MRNWKWPKCLVAGAFAALLMCCPNFRSGADLTAPQVLERCKKAYGALKSYKGTTLVVTKATIGGTKQTFATSANIEFVRPGKIRVEGKMMTMGGFIFISDGAQTWQKTQIMNGGKWQKAQNIEMAIATFTGTSQNAATAIPALLVNVNWGNPFGPTLRADKVRREMVGKAVALRLEATSAIGRVTYWIDPRTFLLTRKHEVQDIGKISSQQGIKLPEGMPSTGMTDATETYPNVRPNVPIPASRFVRPADAPK